ncbi:GIY-YIG nuclease family protein [Nanoarchaeota archaeon]|nr:MAG: GIY-YIG nuclease family protein [Nanoarchaeota archaeon]
MRGIYVLLIEVKKDLRIRIGKLGTIDFRKGTYAYVGSAQNSLEKRVERHLKRRKRRFWHIDHLLSNPHVKVLKVFWKEERREWECLLARKLGEKYEAVRGFGCSDCKCTSHLFKVGKRFKLPGFSILSCGGRRGEKSSAR